MFFRKRQNKLNLDDVAIAAPCPIQWSEMEGTERVRFCSSCKLNVYNISEMTRTEATELLESHSGQLCLTLYRRKDGTLITKDCPIGRRILDAVQRRARAAAIAFLALFNVTAVFAESEKSISHLMGGPRGDSLPWTTGAVPATDSVDPFRVGLSADTDTNRLKPDTSALRNYQQAIQYEKIGETNQALHYYDQAISALRGSATRYDPKFAAEVAGRYARLLEQEKKPEQAKSLEKEFCLKQ